MILPFTRRAVLVGAAGLAAFGVMRSRAGAGVTLIVPYPPGGAVDLLGRLIAERLGRRLGTDIVVENRGGAGGSIGAAAVARAEPDGTTLGLLNVTQLIVNKYLYASLPYDPDADLAPVSRVATGTILAVANAEAARANGWKTLRDLVEWSKRNPYKVRMGSSGVGTISHLGIELVKAKTGASIVHVPYKGGGPAIIDCLAGVVEMMFDVIPALAPHVREGAMVPLGVASAGRIAAMPDVPSMKEFADIGLGDVDIETWYAIVGPKDFGGDLRDRLCDAIGDVMADPEVRDRLAPAGFTPLSDPSPKDLEKRIAAENPGWRELARISGAKIE